MGPVDKRLLGVSPAARIFVAASLPLALATALTIVVQATLLGRIVEDVFLGHRGLAAVEWPLILLAAAALARGLLAELIARSCIKPPQKLRAKVAIMG